LFCYNSIQLYDTKFNKNRQTDFREFLIVVRALGGWGKGNNSWRRISQPARHRFAQAIAGGSEIRKIAAVKKEAAKARAGPEGETSFPYGVNKNFLAP